MSHQQNPAPATTEQPAPALPVVPVVPVPLAPAPTVPAEPQDGAATPVLDLRVGGVRLMLEVPARLHVLASGLITSAIAGGLGYLFAGR
ncbi:hypothetical protein [Kitasatospora sp. NPDC093806]|uniref:hypothetical protein n=1 Tax=Kitasatospora sp. NPDC093806 TaxID=3155075 RepID=UPI003416CC18